VHLNGVQFEETKVRDFCRKHGIARLALFGSVLRGDSTPESDLDILVDFEPGRRVSLFDLGGMATELSGLLGREVDLRTPQDLSRHFRDEVVRDSRPLYAA
jgi:predicted nucleotidyltransferase